MLLFSSHCEYLFLDKNSQLKKEKKKSKIISHDTSQTAAFGVKLSGMLTGSTKEEGESPDVAAAYFFGENMPAVADQLVKFLII